MAGPALPPSVKPPGGPAPPIPGGDAPGWFQMPTGEMQCFEDYVEPAGYAVPQSPAALTHLMRCIAQHVPSTVAPNSLTLAGLGCLVYALLLAYQAARMDIYPIAKYLGGWPANVLCCVLLGAYYALHGIGDIHARRIRNHTNLGSLLASAADAAAPCFSIPTLCICFRVNDPPTCMETSTSWAVCSAYHWELRTGRRCGMRRIIPDAAAIVPVFGMLLVASAVFPADCIGPPSASPSLHFAEAVTKTVATGRTLLGPSLDLLANEALDPPNLYSRNLLVSFVTCYSWSLLAVLCSTLRMLFAAGRDRRGALFVLTCVVLRVFPNAAHNFGLWGGTISTLTVIEDGLLIGALMTEMHLWRMARRQRRPGWVCMIYAGTLTPQGVALVLYAAYHCSLFYSLSAYMRLPIFDVVTTVYVDGVWDNPWYESELERAATYGNRLIVGVLSEQNAAQRHLPVQRSHAERCSRAQSRRCVTKVVDAPLCVDKDLIEQHQIRVVLCTRDNWRERDKYYEVRRGAGILECVDGLWVG